MVIQHGVDQPVKGVAKPGSQISVTFQGNKATGSANADGEFSVVIPPLPITKDPFNISVTDGSSTITLSDVMVGMVFVASGQSNCELPVLATVNASKYIANAGNITPYLRVFQLNPEQAYVNQTTPQMNFTIGLPWARPSSSNIGGYSAVAYYTAINLAIDHPDTPIGFIASSWGGTAIDVWMSPASLAACGSTSSSSSSSSISISSSPMTSAPSPYSVSTAVPTKPSVLWNTMMYPLSQQLQTAGWLWFQGEANAGNPVSYASCFPAMISQWRKDWLPSATPATPRAFVFVQLSTWPAWDIGMIAGQRYAQTAALNLENVGMAVAADIGDPAGSFHPIHSPYKQELGRRLSLVFEHLTFGNTFIPLQGPVPISVQWDSWNSSWGRYHHGVAGGVCNEFRCGGIRVTFDQPISLVTDYEDQHGVSGFALWNDVSGSVETGTASMGTDQLMSPLCTNFLKCPAAQPVEVTGILEDGVTLQLNTTFVFGTPKTLKYGFSDYPVMPVFDTVYGRPAPPFNLTVSGV